MVTISGNGWLELDGFGIGGSGSSFMVLPSGLWVPGGPGLSAPEPSALALLLVAGLGGLAVVLITFHCDVLARRRVGRVKRVPPEKTLESGGTRFTRPTLRLNNHARIRETSVGNALCGVPCRERSPLRNATEGVPYRSYKRLLRLEPLEDRALLSTTWYVATTGSNSNAGTSLSAPFQTIQQAASVAQPSDTVYICAGTYHETVTPANSGTAGAPITYEPYDGGDVVVDGANPVTGWTLDNNGADGPIYEATMNWSYNNGDGNQVFVNGQMMNYARWPNTSLDVSDPTKAVAATASYTVLSRP